MATKRKIEIVRQGSEAAFRKIPLTKLHKRGYTFKRRTNAFNCPATRFA